MAASDSKGQIHLCHVARGQQLLTWQGHTNLVKSVTFSPKGSPIMIVDLYGFLIIAVSLSIELSELFFFFCIETHHWIADTLVVINESIYVFKLLISQRMLVFVPEKLPKTADKSDLTTVNASDRYSDG